MKFLFADRVGPWRSVYAWLPVRLFDGSLIWFKEAERARFQTKAHLPGPMNSWWGYRLHGDRFEE